MNELKPRKETLVVFILLAAAVLCSAGCEPKSQQREALAINPSESTDAELEQFRKDMKARGVDILFVDDEELSSVTDGQIPLTGVTEELHSVVVLPPAIEERLTKIEKRLGELEASPQVQQEVIQVVLGEEGVKYLESKLGEIVPIGPIDANTALFQQEIPRSEP